MFPAGCTPPARDDDDSESESEDDLDSLEEPEESKDVRSQLVIKKRRVDVPVPSGNASCCVCSPSII